MINKSKSNTIYKTWEVKFLIHKSIKDKGILVVDRILQRRYYLLGNLIFKVKYFDF